MKKDKGVSAVIGVILMVSITVAIAATVYVYVSNMLVDDTTIEDKLESIIFDKVIITNNSYKYNDIFIYEKIKYSDFYEVEFNLIIDDNNYNYLIQGIIINIDTGDIYFNDSSDLIKLRK